MNEVIYEIEDISFGHKRVNGRAKKILASLYEGVGKGLSASFGGSSEIKGAYRFFDNNLVNPTQILEPHYEKTIERIKEHKIVGFIQDTTDIDMKHMKNVENLGVLNDSERPGCSLHPVIAFTPDKLCLGIVNAKFIIRPAKELGRKASNNSRAIEEKESFRWIEGYQVACRIAKQCPDTLCVSIGDRESDIYELLLETILGEAELIARAWHDRLVLLPPSEKTKDLQEKNKKLAEENKKLATINETLRKRKKKTTADQDQRKANSAIIIVNKNLIKENKEFINKDEEILHKFMYQLKNSLTVGEVEFILPEGRGRKSRVVKQRIKAIRLTLRPSKHKQDLPQLSINAVLLEEIEIPEGEEPISWMFLTTLPIKTLENIQLIVTLYLSRWGIELFFKVLKSGCKIEELRFKEASRLLGCISIYMIIAWRIMYATYIGRTCPELPCSILFEKDEWQAVYAVAMKAQPPKTPPSLGEFIKMVATLGGYRGRKSDGPPGTKVMWIGLQVMHKLAEGWGACRNFG